MHEILAVAALPGYPPEIGAALWRLQDARLRTLRLLKDIPTAFIDREARGNAIGTILYHLALIETDYLCVEILEKPYPDELKALLPVDDRDPAGLLVSVRGQSMEKHLQRLSAVRRALLDGLRGMVADDFYRLRSLPAYDVSPEWVLHHLAQHEAEHRGEIGSILAQLQGERDKG